MFISKNKYFLIIENTKDIDFRYIKKLNKYNVIYRNNLQNYNIDELLHFRSICKSKKIKFYVANNRSLTVLLKADGVYISANNYNLRFVQLKKQNYEIIGSAHNIKEFNIKILQGCSEILFSRLFKTSYTQKRSFLGIVKFNLLNQAYKKNLIPLGGIKMSNLNKLKLLKSDSFALMSEIKKKPAKIFNRLF
jgi:thiamine-phosphate pyrophosphorylase